ncbi:MAG: flagellar hook-length control protein FliK, partial [Geminicoccaceae bacterium]
SQANRMDRLPHRSPAEQVISALDGGPLSDLSDPRFSQHQQPLAGIRPPSAVASSPSGLSDGLQPPSAPASQVTLPFAPQTKARAASASPAGLSDNPSKPAHQGQVQHAQAGGDPTIEPLVRALTPTDVQRVTGSIEGGDAEPLFGDLVSGDSVKREFGVTPPAPKPVLQTSQPPGAQIALQIARSHAQGVDRLSVQLHPAELGAVEIRLNFGDDGRVSALIAAERPDTLDLLQRDGRQLERSLNDSGLRLESGGLAFTLKQDQHQQGQGSNASAQHQGRAYQDSEALERAENAGPEPLPGRTGNLRLLDIST